MSREVLYCTDETEVDEVLSNMGDIQVRRLPVVDDHKQLVGVVALGDLSFWSSDASGKALAEITRPTGIHSQGADVSAH